MNSTLSQEGYQEVEISSHKCLEFKSFCIKYMEGEERGQERGGRRGAHANLTSSGNACM